MPASLTTEMGLKGPQVMISTLTKHYFGATISDDDPNKELLYRQAFTLFKSFLETSTRHTVEELQQFSNIRTPSPYWVHAPRVLVPLVCCDQAATYLIAAVGGEESAKKVFGGIKWWQVRGVKGIDGQWISQRKDWQEAKRRRAEKEAEITRIGSISKGKGLANKDGEFGEILDDGPKGKEKEKEGQDIKPTEDKPEPDYTSDMDEMRCMLYLHGGGYYFGSIDQQRFVIQRYARKMNGRVFAINYRLAPQYPFPCAIQDAIAAYLFLIRPPEGAKHAPVPPSSIVIAGDSAGGGLALSVLQVIRDSGLPAPAGGVLISPWVDLTHSFPSIHINTATDIVPPTGLSMHKPSLLWPPPNEETTKNVRNNLAEKIRRFTKIGHSRAPSQESVLFNTRGDVTLPNPMNMSSKANKSMGHLKVPDAGKSREPSSSKNEGRSQTPGPGLRPSTSTPAFNALSVATMHRTEPSESFTIQIDDTLYQIKSQIQLYTTNNNLNHPLVSPINAYMGGLPPLFIMAGDKEVLRDEILYLAHKAAYPDRYPLRPDLRASNPLMEKIKERFPNPTQVHLQVYDETCHVLPLFTFTTPAKFAFRAVATFCKHIMPDKMDKTDKTDKTMFSPVQVDLSLPSFSFDSSAKRNDSGLARTSSFKLTGFLARGNSAFSRTLSSSRKSTLMGSGSTPASPTIGDVGPRFQRDSTDGGPGTAGYAETYRSKPLTNGIVTERVSTKGLVRDFDLHEEIERMGMSLDTLGMVNEFGVKRYLDAQSVWEKRFKDTLKGVAKQRRKQIDEAEKEDSSRFTKLKASVMARDTDDVEKNLLLNSAKWSWSWVVSGEENPPPSSIVARRDTTEARRLSKIADESVEEKESRMSGNNLWAIIVNALTAGPEHPPKSPVTSPKSPTWNSSSNFKAVQSPTGMTFGDFDRSGLDRPASPARSSIFRASGLRSTSSLATSISNDVVRIRRPSFGSLRIGRGRYLDGNGEVMSHRQSVVSELPPALPSVAGLGRDDTFTKLALEGIAEVRVSEDSPASPLNASGTKAPGATGAKNVPPPLSLSAAATEGTSSAFPTANGSGSGTSNGNGNGNGTGISNGNGSSGLQRRGTLGALGTTVKRKAIPAQLFEEAGIDPSQSPYASKESLTKLSNASQSKLPRTGSTSGLSTKSSSGLANGLQNEKTSNTANDIPPTPSISVSNGDATAPSKPEN